MNGATYELWDVEAGNLIGTFASEAGAFLTIRELLAINGTDYAADLERGRHAASGDFLFIGSGTNLAELSNTPDSTVGSP